MMVPPVVAGVDGSEESLRAVEWAALEARRHRAPLWVISAAALPRHASAYGSCPPLGAATARKVSSRALSDAVVRAEELVPDLLIATDLLSVGPPAVAVTEAGSGALMLVLGARGAGDFAAMLLGSVSRYAAMHATCPVVAVREETNAVHREVVVGVRDPDEARETLAFAFEEAALRTATLVVAHACERFPSLTVGVKEAEEHLSPGFDDWRHKYPDVPVRQDVVHCHPARLLASYSARADLVVIGRHGEPGGRGPAIGATQHAVLQHARGPVAIVPSAV